MLQLHRSERADYLVESLGDLLNAPSGDPMAREVVAVPTRGVERWLTQRLAHRLGVSQERSPRGSSAAGVDEAARGDGTAWADDAARGGDAAARADGVCANIEFPFPGNLIMRATAVACGIDPDDDPWAPDRSVWPLLDLVDESLHEPWMAPLADHLRAAVSGGETVKTMTGKGLPKGAAGEPHLRRFATVRHLADLFDRYAVHRPEMVLAWLQDASESSLHDNWQALLWRHLRAAIGIQSPVERNARAIEAIEADPAVLDLPDRLSVFGLTRLPASHLRTLAAVGAGRDVHLYLLHPSGVLWDRLEAMSVERPRTFRRTDDPTAAAALNPLLRSWGRDSREMQLVLRANGVSEGEHRPVVDAGADNLLRILQRDIRDNRSPTGRYALDNASDDRPELDEMDDSVRVHSCHGRARQVEVVRDAVLHLLASDPTLEPRDIIVMCPDIEAFAPLVQAAFGVFDPLGLSSVGTSDGSAPCLRVRLADRSLRQTNPLLGAAAHLLEMAGSRVTASDVLDFASREPVSRRFGLDEDDLSRIERWVVGTGIRWGLDGDHRASWSLAGVSANTWSAGLDRLMLGVAMTETGGSLFGQVLPYDEVQGVAVDLAGRMAELVNRLRSTLSSLSVPQGVDKWVAHLARGTESLCLAELKDTWQSDQLRRVLTDVADTAVEAHSKAELDWTEARSLLDERLRGRPTRANFRTGDLTICTLVPMRSVPHKVVCLLGLDDGVFPRNSSQDGDDLLLLEPEIGDRDPRTEDRQLLLDAILAATSNLVITYEGRDQRTNQERPPAVPLAELLDVIDRTVRPPYGVGRPRDVVTVRHPLQSFDARNFTPGALGEGGPWGYDSVNLRGAYALGHAVDKAGRFLPERLPARAERVVQLGLLIRWLEHPTRRFLAERLGIYLDDSPDVLIDDLPVELDPLEKWSLGDRLLTARLAGVSVADARLAEVGRGLLPPGELGQEVLADVVPTVEALVERVEALHCWALPAQSVEIRIPLPDGRSLVGTVPGVHLKSPEVDVGRQATILRYVYSRVGPKHRLNAWARFLALTAASPRSTVTGLTIGRDPEGSRNVVRLKTVEFPALAGKPDERQARALESLGVLVDLYDRGMREPLPLACETSAAWAEASRSDGDCRKEATDCWTTFPGQFKKENADPAHRLVWGSGASLDDLLAEPPLDDEAGSGWVTSEHTRAGRLARRLWDDLVTHEVTVR